MFNSINRDDLTLSIRDGICFPFMYKGHQVVVHNAAWSFREKIWVDDSVVVNQLGFSMASSHTIDVAGDPLEIQFGYRDRMTTVFLEVRSDGQLVHEVTHTFDNQVRVSTILLFAVLGAAVGYGLGYIVGTLLGGA